MTPTPKKPAPAGSRQELGRLGETLAAEYLQAKGYRILERNFRSSYGEIDLIACQMDAGSLRDGSVLVFVEVKTRSTNAYGYPEESVTPAKQAHLLQASQAYLQQHPEQFGDWRIDVIAIRTSRSAGPAEIKHFENAVH